MKRSFKFGNLRRTLRSYFHNLTTYEKLVMSKELGVSKSTLYRWTTTSQKSRSNISHDKLPELMGYLRAHSLRDYQRFVGLKSFEYIRSQGIDYYVSKIEHGKTDFFIPHEFYEDVFAKIYGKYDLRLTTYGFLPSAGETVHYGGVHRLDRYVYLNSKFALLDNLSHAHSSLYDETWSVGRIYTNERGGEFGFIVDRINEVK